MDVSDKNRLLKRIECLDDNQLDRIESFVFGMAGPGTYDLRGGCVVNNTENVFLRSLDMKVSQLILEIRDTNKKEESKKLYQSIPEWVTLQQAAKYKGGAAFDTYKTQYWLQPCCGLNSRKIGGRKSWRREDVIEWLSVTDDHLWEYALRKGASIPAKYEKITGK